MFCVGSDYLGNGHPPPRTGNIFLLILVTCYPYSLCRLSVSMQCHVCIAELTNFVDILRLYDLVKKRMRSAVHAMLPVNGYGRVYTCIMHIICYMYICIYIYTYICPCYRLYIQEYIYAWYIYPNSSIRIFDNMLLCFSRLTGLSNVQKHTPDNMGVDEFVVPLARKAPQMTWVWINWAPSDKWVWRASGRGGEGGRSIVWRKSIDMIPRLTR